MFCETCRRFRAPREDRVPAFCEACGHPTTSPDRVRIEADRVRLRYLLDEVRAWSESGLIDRALGDRLAHPYEAEFAAAGRYLEGLHPTIDRAAPPRCHEALEASCRFCPDCGVDLASWRAWQARQAAYPPASIYPAPVVIAAAPVAAPTIVPAPTVIAAAPVAAVIGTGTAEQAAPVPVPSPGRASRLLQELRPVFYENLILFLGAFLMFAGSIYFAVYFWDRFGQFGPLVAGGLLAIYGLGFAGVGYLLQRRYHVELSARVLYGVGTAILPVAATLLGEPIRTGSSVIGVLAACVVGISGAIAYPAIFTAASLFQREIGKPFARCFVALLWAIGLAPVVAASGFRVLAIVYVYLAAVPVLAMYRRVREIGRVFESATVVYVVGGSAYMVVVLAVRVSLAMSPGLAPEELAPLLVLVATAAIDLDVAWRQQSHAARSALGVVGVLAQGAAVLAIVIAFADPFWRVLTTLSAGLVFAVTALRHRRPSAVHFAIATVAAGGLLIVWMPFLDPPHGVALGGLLLLPLSAGLARLGARWRRHAALDFAAPCELWATLCPILAALSAGLSLLGPTWQLAQLGRFSAYGPVLIVLPSSAAVLALAWSWGRRRHYLAVSAIAAASTVLSVASMAGARTLGLALISACLTLGLVGAAVLRRRRDAADASQALLDAALVLLATTAGLLGVDWIGPWHGVGAAASAMSFVLLTCAAVAVASQRPRREVGVVAVLAMTVAAAAGLWAIVPHELIPGILAIGLLALDLTKADVAIGKAQPFQDAYTVALVAVALQVIQIVANTTALETVSPLGSGLVALALLAIAARHRSPWPTYGAVGCLLAAAYGAPAALELAVRPRLVAEGAGLVVIVIAIGLRAWPRLRGWRTTFLDIPLHLAAAAAPLGFLRFLGSFADWELNGAPHSYVLLRRLASPLGCAVLAAIMHGSRAHAYLVAAASMFVLPAVIASLGLDGGAIAPALAGAGLIALIGVHAIARRPAFVAPVTQGDRPLRLFGQWPLPSAATHRDLWIRPIGELALLAALAAWAMACQQLISSWPSGSNTAVWTYVLLATYAITRCIKPVIGDKRYAPVLATHAACTIVALLCTEVAQRLGLRPDGEGDGLVLLGSGFLLLGEALARIRHPAARPGARAALEWAIVFLLVPITVLVHPTHLTTPCAAVIFAVAVIRHGHHYRVAGARTASSIAATAASGFVVLWLLGQVEWLVPEGVAISALAITAVLAAWVHWWARDRLHLGEAFRLVSAWASVGCLLALASAAFDAPPSAPALLPAWLALATLLAATAWFVFAAVRTARDRHGHAAQVTLLLLYVCVRTSPLGSGLSLETDAIVAIGAAFTLHFLSELLQRAKLTALERPAVFGARVVPVAACMIVWIASADQGELPTLQHAFLAETLGLLYTLAARRSGHRALGLVAICFYNLGLVLLWICTDRQDALYYVVPVGVSITLLARIYRTNMSRSARRGLRAAGALLIYFATYYQVVQFDQGLYPILLGGFTLVGITLGFFLQLRELFVLSIGFLVLDVISNLAYYGAHRPVLGWTLLTVAGLCLTVSGVVFQLRRGQVRGFVAGVRATLSEWD